MNSRAFWPLIGIASLLEALAAAAFAIAVFSDPPSVNVAVTVGTLDASRAVTQVESPRPEGMIQL